MIEVREFDSGQVHVRHRFAQGSVQIGRHPANDLVLGKAHVSARHARIVHAGQGLVLHDLESTNGSAVLREGVRIEADEAAGFRVDLLPGDMVLLGDPEQPVRLKVFADELQVDEEGLLLEDTADLEVLARLDVGDATRLHELSSSFPRDALLAMHEFAIRAGAARTSESLLQQLAASALELFPDADCVRVYLDESGSGRIQPILAQGRDASLPFTALSRTVERLVRAQHEALSFSRGDPGFDSAESLRQTAVRAAMCAPIWASGTLLGVVQVDCSRERRLPFGPHDLRLLAVLSGQLALALDNLRLNGDLEQTISELRKAQAQMETLAFRDPLTGLSNRRLLQDRLEQAIKTSRRVGQRVALVYMDLDEFKRINDSFGHDVGDQLLMEVSLRLKGCLRAPDTVARLGGDEFAAVLVNLPDASGARTVARKMLDALRAPIEVPGHSMVVTASIGITMAPDDALDVSDLMRNADLAMYRCKSQGGDGFSFFTEDLNREAARRLSIENELRSGLESAQFTEYFQPLHRFGDNEVVAMEALVRWQHPKHGLTLPDSFIRIAEDTGLIVALGRNVMRNACAAARLLSENRKRALSVAVNLSARQFQEPDLPHMVGNIIEETGIAPQSLELEITESMLMEDSQEVRARLASLKDLGVSLTIDDFGTGYSSLSYLKRLPVDSLKIDRSFVQGLPADSADAEIAAAIIAMAHKLGLRVVAEGVETAEQLAFLRDNRCDVYQGFFADRPLPLDEVKGRLLH